MAGLPTGGDVGAIEDSSVFGPVLDRLRCIMDIPGSVTAGGAYWSLEGPLSRAKPWGICLAGADGAGRIGIIEDESGAPGGRGAGRLGKRPPLSCGSVGDVKPPVVDRVSGIGGGDRGFSKLS